MQATKGKIILLVLKVKENVKFEFKIKTKISFASKFNIKFALLLFPSNKYVYTQFVCKIWNNETNKYLRNCVEANVEYYVVEYYDHIYDDLQKLSVIKVLFKNQRFIWVNLSKNWHPALNEKRKWRKWKIKSVKKEKIRRGASYILDKEPAILGFLFALFPPSHLGFCKSRRPSIRN